MKNLFKNILAVLLVAIIIAPVYSQDKRTLDTKVADILMQFPAENRAHSKKLMKEIVSLGESGIAKFCGMIVPAGTGDDTQARYAIASLAQYAGAADTERRSLIEKSLLQALAETSDHEEKSFFIDQLAYCGSNGTVNAMEEYLSDNVLCAPALATLTIIGSEKAAKSIFDNTGKASDKEFEFIKALGVLQYKPAENYLISKATDSDSEMKKQAYAALAKIGSKASLKTLQNATKNAGYKLEETEAIIAYIEYIKQLASNGNTALSNKLATSLLKKCKGTDQLIFRSSALRILRTNQGTDAISLLLKEIENDDKKYRNAVLWIAQKGISSNEVNQWVNIFPKVSPEIQVELLHFLASRPEEAVLNDAILPALVSQNMSVRNEAMLALAINQKNKAVEILSKQLAGIQSKEEFEAAKKALLISCSAKDCGLLVEHLGSQSDEGKKVIIEVLSSRRAVDHFNDVKVFCSSTNETLRKTAFSALPKLAVADNLEPLINLLEKSTAKFEIEAVQLAIANIYLSNKEADDSLVLNKVSTNGLTEKLLPVLPYLKNKNALKKVAKTLKTGSSSDKEAAYNALTKWQDASAMQILFDVFIDDEFAAQRASTISAYVSLMNKAQIPDDQKLLWLDKIMNKCSSNKEKSTVIKAAGSAKTFLSLMFVSKYIDDNELGSAAANSAMRIALPSSGKKNGLVGNEVSKILKRIKEKLTGRDSQYAKIDIQEYLDKMPAETGYVSIFNGKDLEGWQGLVKNPIARAKMSEKELAKAQKEADAKVSENWSVKDGTIVFDGHGQNLCTKKMYRDFDMLVDWRINKDGDSGIYLRGTPQVQIWDTSRVDVGAQVGSGGLYNNQKNASKPLVLADNAIGDWNTFRIRMIDDRVTVYLNGQLVVGNVIMENYWDRNIPIFREGAIELQAHGNELAFRNIYVREINADKSSLSAEEQQDGFVSLFNGKDLDKWVGNKTDYTAKDGMIVVDPQKGTRGTGNLFTDKDYSNFIFRFEFQLTPGANNGLGIHAPLEGDAAYLGKELQILDNTASIYANLKPYQYHGSVYGIIPAKRGALKPVGEWNSQEVIVNGDAIKITLNGIIIVDGNFKEATKNGTLDKKDHPGLNRYTGRIGFLGHGSKLKFRNIRIKEL